MITVFTKNGLFNISQSLYESIRNNNPEFLIESNEDLADVLIKALKNKLGIAGTKEQIRLLRNYLNSKDLSNHMTNDEWKDLQNEVSQLFVQEKREEVEDLIKNATGDNKKVSEEDIKKNINDSAEEIAQKVLPNDEKPLINATSVENNEKIEQEKDKNTSPIVKKQQSKVSRSKKISDGKISVLKDFIKNPKLKKEIINSEELAISLVKYIKRINYERLGVLGSDTQAAKSFSKDAYDEDNKNSDAVLPNKVKMGAYKYYNDSDVRTTGQRVPLRNRYQKTSPYSSKNLGAEAKLALGGFKLNPIPDNNEYLGLSLRFIGDAMEMNSGSILAKMISTEYKIRNHQEKELNATKTEIKAFDEMVKRFLQNISYQLVINSTEEFSRIIQVMKYDPKIRNNFNVREMNDIRVMDSKRTIITFVEKKSGNIALVIIAEPFLARTKELLKRASPLVSKISSIHV